MDARRAMLEDERRHVLGKLHRLRGSSAITGAETVGLDDIADEAERAQASLRQHLEVATCERLADRIARLNDALQRLGDGSYGTCEHCGTPVDRKRLRAVPEATSCVACQEALERLDRLRLTRGGSVL
jgi:DnaK suppressor protein